MLYTLCFIIFIIGLYAVIVKKNVVKMVLGLMIIEYSINLFIIMLGYRHGGSAPIVEKTAQTTATIIVDPLSQSMVFSSIIIGLGLLIFMVALCIRLYERYGTFDITEMRRLKG